MGGSQWGDTVVGGSGGGWGGGPSSCAPPSPPPQVEPPQGTFRDDTALNGIRLLCNERGVITSSEGQ